MLGRKLQARESKWPKRRCPRPPSQSLGANQLAASIPTSQALAPLSPVVPFRSSQEVRNTGLPLSISPAETVREASAPAHRAQAQTTLLALQGPCSGNPLITFLCFTYLGVPSWISWKNSSVASKTGVKPPARKTLKTGITRNPLASWPLPAGHCSVGQACQAPPQGWNGSFQQDSRACLGQAVAEGEPSHSGSIVKEDATEGGWRPRGDGGCLCP